MDSLHIWYHLIYISVLWSRNCIWLLVKGGFPCSSVGKESACSAGDLGLIPGLGRSPGGGNGKPLQYTCLENPMDRGAWWATVHGVTRVGHNLATNPLPLVKEIGNSDWNKRGSCFFLTLKTSKDNQSQSNSRGPGLASFISLFIRLCEWLLVSWLLRGCKDSHYSSDHHILCSLWEEEERKLGS